MAVWLSVDVAIQWFWFTGTVWCLESLDSDRLSSQKNKMEESTSCSMHMLLYIYSPLLGNLTIC